MNMRVLSAAALSLLPLAALAAEAVETAQVVSVTPNYARGSAPRQECWTEQQPVTTQAPAQSSGKDYTGAVIGGIAGAILGNQVGKGSGKTVATAAGAVTGAMVGDNMNNSGGTATAGTTYQPVERCRTVEGGGDTVTGYQVVYTHKGRQYMTDLTYDPGRCVYVNKSNAVVGGCSSSRPSGAAGSSPTYVPAAGQGYDYRY